MQLSRDQITDCYITGNFFVFKTSHVLQDFSYKLY